MKIGIIGYGHVGQAMHKIFKDAIIYDIKTHINTKLEINGCDVVFICVPTPSLISGECDVSIVEEVISWVQTKLIILRSTIRIGFTDEMINKYKKRIIFQPEYYGETINHPFADLNNQNWLSFGGSQNDIDLAIKAYQTVVNSNIKIYQDEAKVVEMAKYMENAYLATKVTFCNEMYDIAAAYNINYNRAREIWLADPRIGASHTFIYDEKRGYGGSCLPKDVASIIFQANQKNVNADFLKNVVIKNNLYNK